MIGKAVHDRRFVVPMPVIVLDIAIGIVGHLLFKGIGMGEPAPAVGSGVQPGVDVLVLKVFFPAESPSNTLTGFTT